MIGARPRRGAVRAAVLLVTVAAVLVTTGRPAGADPARPTNFESRILSVDPPIDGATVEIQGGDAFVVLTVERGHEATVPDYGDDDTERPYLRFAADGIVQVNENSAAASANESRFGSPTADFDPAREPRWRTVADNGSYAWHDHRVHLMVPDHMAVVDEQGRVDLGGDDGTWEVPLVIDGVDTVVRGELVRLDAPPAWPWYLGVALVGAALVVLLALTSTLPRFTAALLLLLAAVAATFVSITELSRAPEGSGASSAPVLIAVAALVGSAAGLGARGLGSRGGSLARGGTALAAATSSWWGLTRHDVFANAILPSGLGALDRATTAGALAVGLASAVVLVWRPASLSDATATPGAPDRG